jgi:hypothetical protein
MSFAHNDYDKLSEMGKSYLNNTLGGRRLTQGPLEMSFGNDLMFNSDNNN